LAINARDVTGLSDDDRKDLKRSMEMVETGEEFWELNEINFSIVVSSIASGKPLPEDAPLYLGSNLALTTNHITWALGVFGPTAPTVYHGSKIFNVAKIGSTDQNLLKDDAGRRNLRYIPVKMVSINTAVIHWSSVRSQGRIRIPAARKGKEEFCNREGIDMIISGEAFDGIYNSIRSFVTNKTGEAPKKVRDDKGKKRAIDFDDTGSVAGSIRGSVEPEQKKFKGGSALF